MQNTDLSIDWKTLFSEWKCLTATDAAILTKEPLSFVRKELFDLEERGKAQEDETVGRHCEPLRGIWYKARGKRLRPFKNQRHHRAVVRSVSWILKQYPGWDVFSEQCLRHKFGWYFRLAPNYWTEMGPYYTYVPDALFKIENNYLRLEVQLSRINNDYFAVMFEAARDNHPVLLVCLPNQLDYFWYRCRSLRRVRVVSLGEETMLREAISQFDIENPATNFSSRYWWKGQC